MNDRSRVAQGRTFLVVQCKKIVIYDMCIVFKFKNLIGTTIVIVENFKLMLEKEKPNEVGM